MNKIQGLYSTSKALIIMILLLFSFQSIQAQIRGQVIDAQTNQPIDKCNVYLAGYTLGTITNDNGYFALQNVPNGVYELVFSHVSYQKYIEVVEINNQEVQLKVQLGEDVRELETFVIRSGKVRGKRRRDLRKFKEFFYGANYNENLIEIDNEDVLDFKRDQGITTTTDDYSLFMTNEYLGYDISYYLKDYLYSEKTKMVLGFPKFTAIDNDNPATDYYWMENRQRAYNGSVRHFFKALIARDLDGAGFEAYLTRRDPEYFDEAEEKFYGDEDSRKMLDPKELPMNFTIEDTDISTIKKVNFAEILEINYRNEFDNAGGFQNSKIKLVEPYVYVYTNGVVLNPSALKLYGQVADEGVFGMLPFDYESNDTLVIKDNKDRIRLLNQAAELSKEKLTEKIYVHTNRDDYFQGETIWFKTYAVAGPNHQPSPLSIKTFVELIHADSVYRSAILEAQEGMTNGSLDIPEDAPAGTYVIRAYTNWMKNESASYFFRKSILISDLQSEQSQAKANQQSTRQIDLQFFPESGALVEGIAQKVAFKAIDKTGFPVAIEGQIWDNNNELITEFKSSHDGMGTFTLKADRNQRFVARLKGSNEEFDLDRVRAEHYLKVDALSDSTNIKLEVIGTDQPDEELFLIAQARGWLNYTLQFDLEEGKKSLLIPRNALKEGIIHFTIFDEKGRALAERLAYNDRNERLKVRLSSTKDTYEPREGVDVTVSVTDEKGNPVSGYFSLSAINVNSVKTAPSGRSISTEFLITSDLKGYIHQPENYFDPNNEERWQQLDLVMLTHGWTRFTWDDLEDKIEEEYTYTYDEGIDVKGRMLIQGRKKPVRRGFVTYVSNQQDNPQTEFVETDRRGRFYLDQVNPKGQEPVMLKGMTKRGNNYIRFEIDSTMEFPDFLNSELAPFKTKELSQVQAASSSLFQTNNELKGQNESLNTEEETDSIPLIRQPRKSMYGNPTGSYKFDEFRGESRQGSVFQYMQGRIPGVRMTPEGPVIRGTQNNPFEGMGLGEAASDSLGTEGASPLIEDSNLPMLFLDNTRVDYPGVSSLPVDLVERVEVYKGPDAIVFGMGAQSGAIMIFTKIDMEDELAAFNGAFNIKVKGFHQAREFYQPKYGNPFLEFGPDHRKTLHWEPNVVTDENGKATVKFYNSDDLSEVLLKVEGISTTGTPGSAIYYYKMKGKANEQSQTNLARKGDF